MSKKVYLSKSNQCNPEDVMIVRTQLTKNGYEVVEYQGGEYSPEPLMNSDYIVVITLDKKRYVGRGQYDQVRLCVSAPKFKNRMLFVTRIENGNIYVQEIRNINIHDIDNWKLAYGVLDLSTYEVDLSTVMQLQQKVDEEEMKFF